MDRIQRPAPGPIPTPVEFRTSHGPTTTWSSGVFDEYDTVLAVAARGDLVWPGTPTPSSATTRGDFVWKTTANHRTCDGCKTTYRGSSCPNCTTTSSRTLVAAGRVQRGGTVAMNGRITPRALATARNTLPAVEQQLATGVRGTRRQVLTWRAEGARAALTAGATA